VSSQEDYRRSEDVSVDEPIYVASQWRLTWWRFRKHRMALFSLVIVILFYLIVPTADFLAYSDPEASDAYRALTPPQRIHLMDNGKLQLHVYGLESKRDPVTFERVYKTNPDEKHYLRFFAPGYSYKFLGLIPTDIHLLGVYDAKAEDTLFILGTDNQGRDFWSRIMVATQTSLTVGLYLTF